MENLKQGEHTHHTVLRTRINQQIWQFLSQCCLNSHSLLKIQQTRWILKQNHGQSQMKKAYNQSYKENGKFVLAGISSTDSLSTTAGRPGYFTSVFRLKEVLEKILTSWTEWTECTAYCKQTRYRYCTPDHVAIQRFNIVHSTSIGRCCDIDGRKFHISASID